MPEPYAPGAFTKTRRAILEAAARGEINTASDGRFFWRGQGRWVNEPAQWLVHHGLAAVDDQPGNPGRLVTTDAGAVELSPKCSECGGPFAPSEATAGYTTCERCPTPSGSSLVVGEGPPVGAARMSIAKVEPSAVEIEP
jgi:hypothetical protein